MFNGLRAHQKVLNGLVLVDTYRWVHVYLARNGLRFGRELGETNGICDHKDLSRLLQGVMHFGGHVQSGQRCILRRQSFMKAKGRLREDVQCRRSLSGQRISGTDDRGSER